MALTYRYGSSPMGHVYAEARMPSGTEIQFVGCREYVLMGMKPLSNPKWTMIPIRGPERFGSEWWTVKGLKAWVAEFDEIASDEEG